MNWFGAGFLAEYRFATARGTIFTPMLGFDYRHTRADAFREHGADTANLAFGKHNWSSAVASAGMKVEKEFCLGGWLLTPSARVGAEFELADRDVRATTAFTEGALAGAAYRSRSDRMDCATFTAGAGIAARVSERARLTLDYQGAFQKKYNEHRLTAGVQLTF